jgi:hypothetical protein
LDKTDWPFVLVNNAAAARNTPLLEVEKEQLEYEFAVNVFGVIYMTQAVVGVGRMPQGGRIVNIGSVASKVLVPPPVYGATKAAMDALTTFWAGEVSFLWCFSTLYARQPSNEMPDSLVRAVGLRSIHSHPVQFQQICRKSIWWPLTDLQLRFSFLCMNRRELRIASGPWRIWLMLRFC